MKPFNRIVALLPLLWLLSACGRPAAPPGPRLSVWVLDVGQGDASLITFPDGRRLLVDAGPDSCGVDTLLVNSGVTILDGFALTHAHADHIGGARAVLASLSVRRVLLPGRTSVWTPAFTSLVRFVHDTLHIDTMMLLAGDTVPQTGTSDCLVRCLFPDTVSRTYQQTDTLNANSLVLRIDWKGTSVLLAGDINFDSEAALLAEGRLDKAGFLKVPHHGSATSSSSAFLSAISPRLAVISVGKDNPFGHPTEETLARLKQCGCRVMRTDSSGTVRVEMDGEGGIYTDN